MKQFIWPALAAGCLFAAGAAMAATDTPVGKWRTIDDVTHQAKSIVQITEENGRLQGKVVELLNRTPEDIARDGKDPVCTQCEGSRKNQPIVGMTILWDVSRDGDKWSGGRILDPKNGKTYKVTLALADGGNSLDVHGYIGFSLLGRTQTWQRVE